MVSYLLYPASKRLADQQPMYSNESTSGPKPQFEMGQLYASFDGRDKLTFQTKKERTGFVISSRKCRL
jgi:hypothetical protein